MALVRIDIPENLNIEFVKKISSLTNNLMNSILSIPNEENFVICQKHNVNFLLHNPDKVSESDLREIIFIQITLNQGRSKELKSEFINLLASKLSSEIGLNSENIYINLIEVSSDNWHFGGNSA